MACWARVAAARGSPAAARWMGQRRAVRRCRASSPVRTAARSQEPPDSSNSRPPSRATRQPVRRRWKGNTAGQASALMRWLRPCSTRPWCSASTAASSAGSRCSRAPRGSSTSPHRKPGASSSSAPSRASVVPRPGMDQPWPGSGTQPSQPWRQARPSAPDGGRAPWCQARTGSWSRAPKASSRTCRVSPGWWPSPFRKPARTSGARSVIQVTGAFQSSARPPGRSRARSPRLRSTSQGAAKMDTPASSWRAPSQPPYGASTPVRSTNPRPSWTTLLLMPSIPLIVCSYPVADCPEGRRGVRRRCRRPGAIGRSGRGRNRAGRSRRVGSPVPSGP